MQSLFTLAQTNQQRPIIKLNNGFSQNNRKSHITSHASKSGQTNRGKTELPGKKQETKIYSFSKESMIPKSKSIPISGPKPVMNMKIDHSNSNNFKNSLLNPAMNPRLIIQSSATISDHPTIITNNSSTYSKYGKYQDLKHSPQTRVKSQEHDVDNSGF